MLCRPLSKERAGSVAVIRLRVVRLEKVLCGFQGINQVIKLCRREFRPEVRPIRLSTFRTAQELNVDWTMRIHFVRPRIDCETEELFVVPAHDQFLSMVNVGIAVSGTGSMVTQLADIALLNDVTQRDGA